MKKHFKRLTLTTLIWMSIPAFAEGTMFTFLEGTVLRKSRQELVLSTRDGIYWIHMNRPLSFRRQHANGQVSFWVRLTQIHRVRPPSQVSSDASGV